VSGLLGGVETGGTWCVCAIGTGPEEIVAREEFATAEPEPTLARIVDFFRRGPAVRAVGVGSFGPVDLDPRSPTWGYVTTTPKPGWQHVAVGSVIRDALNVPVSFETDVGAAAIGEQRWGAGRDVDTLCYLTVGTGIGGGLLIDGVPFHGFVHPEVGHIRIPHDTARDPFAGACPSHGDCWEGLASGAAMAERWQTPPAALGGDHAAWALEAEYLALGILSIVMIASPALVILGGGVMRHARLMDTVRRRLQELVAGYIATPRLLAPELGDDAGVLGGIALAQDASG
jgi:fructokinase